MMKISYKILTEDIENILSRIPLNKLFGNNFLITGGSGFLTSYLVYTILQFNKNNKKKSTVYALVRDKNKAEKKFQMYIKDDSLKIITQDVCERIILDKKIDYIIHGASQASPKYYGSDPIGTLSPNIFGTKNLLDLAVIKKIKGFLLLSSGEIYGNTSSKISESNFGYVNTLDVRSCYAESKRMAETMCVAWKEQYGVPIKIARIFHTYGPGMDEDDGRVQADFVFNVVNNQNIIMRSSGTVKRPFCYVTDVITGCFLILFNGDIGAAYNVANPNSLTSIMDLAKSLIKLYPEKKLKIIQVKSLSSKGYIKSTIKSQNPDVKKLMNLGWQYQSSIEEGFRRTIASYENS